VAAADGEEAAGAGDAGEPVAVPPDGVLAAPPTGLDDPPHAASSAATVKAPAAQPAAARRWIPV